MEKLIIEIKDNKYTKDEIDNMLNDYISIGENVFKKRTKVVETLIKQFIKNYSKSGTEILSKKRNLKQFLNSAKIMYKFAEFYICNNKESYSMYVYILNKNLKGTKVFLRIKEEKEIIIVYNSIFNFLENWFIYRRVGGFYF